MTLDSWLPLALSLRFPPSVEAELPGIEGRFRDVFARSSQQRVRRVAAMLIGIYLVYIPLTFVIDLGPWEHGVTVAALQVFGLLVSVTVLAFSFRFRRLESLQGITGVAGFLVGAQSSAACLLFPHPYDYLALQSLVLICALVCTTLRLRFFNALVTAFAILIAFGVEAALIGQLSVLEALLTGTYLATAIVVGGFVAYGLERTTRHDYLQEERLARERERSEQLLLNVLPASVAARLKAGEQPIADTVEEATVLFADLVGFTKLSSTISPEELVGRLGTLFSAFDTETERLGLEKIKTIGDAYMVAAGVPDPCPDHAGAAAELGLALRSTLGRLNAEQEWNFGIRIGIHSGPLVAGVIGEQRFSYDVWGDTVNTASRMESHGAPGQIQVSEATRSRLEARYLFEDRGEMEIKGKGPMRTFFLLGAKDGHSP